MLHLPRTLALPLLAACVGCAAHPARFADAPPVTRVLDDEPIPLPQRTSSIDPIYRAEVYVRRPVVQALDARRIGHAQDINALDEVPRSSWFAPVPLDAARFPRAYAPDGPPRLPLSIIRTPKRGPLGALDAPRHQLSNRARSRRPTQYG